MSDNPLDVYVLYATDAEQKFIKVAEDGCLAIFEDEASAKRAKRRHPGTDYKQVNYYSQKQVDQMQADNEALRARVAELEGALDMFMDVSVLRLNVSGSMGILAKPYEQAQSLRNAAEQIERGEDHG